MIVNRHGRKRGKTLKLFSEMNADFFGENNEKSGNVTNSVHTRKYYN